MNQLFNQTLQSVFLSLILFTLLSCTFQEVPVNNPPNFAEYQLTKIEHLPASDVLLDLQHHFKIELSKDIKKTTVEIPLEPHLLDDFDLNTLHLVRIDPEINVSQLVGPLNVFSLTRASIELSESGTYSIAGLPTLYSAWADIDLFCTRATLNPLRRTQHFDRICFVINCPGDFERSSLCDRCFSNLLSGPLIECAIPRHPPDSPIIPGSGCRITAANGYSQAPAISSDGRFVVFTSNATNLVSRDHNGARDVFLRDRENCTTELISVSSSGSQGNRNSENWGSAISGDGRFVVFQSDATNLVSSHTHWPDIYVRDRISGTTERISENLAGVGGDGPSGVIGISGDGRYVAFTSEADNLVPGGITRGSYDHLFIHDRLTGRKEVYLSVALIDFEFEHLGGISGDGKYIVFSDYTRSIGDEEVFLYDRDTGVKTLISLLPTGISANSYSSEPTISADGNWITFETLSTNLAPPDTNGRGDIIVANRLTGEIKRASIDNMNTPSSGGGRGGVSDWGPRLSAQGRYVVFNSTAEDLTDDVTGRVTQVYRRDLVDEKTELVSKHSDGTPGNNRSGAANIDASGDIVVFASSANNLITGDFNGRQDIFLRNMQTGEVELISGHVVP